MRTPGNVWIRDAAWCLFGDSADEDYIIARAGFRRGLAHQFFWSAEQGVEKYTKYALLLNGISVRRFRASCRHRGSCISKCRMRALHAPARPATIRSSVFLRLGQSPAGLGCSASSLSPPRPSSCRVASSGSSVVAASRRRRRAPGTARDRDAPRHRRASLSWQLVPDRKKGPDLSTRASPTGRYETA